jgi:hypothetical protein
MILSLSENGTQPGLLSYSDKIFWSLLHPGHPRREPRKITKIRIEEERIPSMDEMNVENQHEITNCEQKSAYIANSEVISLVRFISWIYCREIILIKSFILDKI